MNGTKEATGSITNGLHGPREGQTGLFFCTAAAETSDDGSTTTHKQRTGHGGLPVELFLNVMGHVRYEEEEDDDGDGGGKDAGELDVIRASQVCVGWRRAILGCGALWTELRTVKAASFVGVDRVRAIAERSKGTLRILTLDFTPSGDMPLSSLPVAVFCKQIFREISQHDGARQLKVLSLDLKPYRESDDAESAYNIIVSAALFAEYSAVNLETLRVLSCLDRYPAGAPFFFALPSLHKLVLTSESYDPPPEGRLPDFFQTTSTIESAQISACHLRTLVLSGTSLMDGNYVSFPSLSTIKLFKVKCCNLLGLLKSCASTLETLWLRKVTSDPSNRFLPPPPAGGTKDLPGVLDLPSLDSLQLCGSTTANLFIAPTQTTSHFIVSTPVLKEASFCSQYTFATGFDEDGDILEATPVTAESLSNLFRNSPWLARLNLFSTNASNQMLVASLPFANASLTTLRIGETPAANDGFIDRLHTLVPQLAWLDVYGRPVYVGEKQVSVQALSRLANRLKGLSPLRRWLSNWELTIVAHQPHEEEPTLATLRHTLRGFLVSLSASQLEHLTSSALTLNSPPNGPSFATVKAEVIALGTPPPTSPVDDPASANGMNGTNGAAPKKKKKKVVARPAADETVVAAASQALKAWVTRREQELAIEWCNATEGVELEWGTAGCGEAKCDCLTEGYPGWDEWYGDEDEDR